MSLNAGTIEYTVSVETQQSIDAANKVNASLDKTEKQMNKNERSSKRFNAALTPLAASIHRAFSRSNTRGIDSTAQQLDGLRRSAVRLAGALGLAFSARSFGSMIKRNIDLANSTLDVAEKLGTTTEELSKLRYVTAQTAGMASGEFDVALQRMTRRLAEAAQGGGVAKDAIEELGLSATALAQSSPDEAFKLILDQMSKLPTQSDRVRLAFKFFDSGGVALANTAKGGAAEIERLSGQLEELGGVISTDTARQSAELNAKLGELEQRFKGVGLQVANDALPALEDFVELMNDPEIARSLGDIASAIVKVGGAAINAAASVADFTKWLAESAAASIHGPAFDDIVRMEDEIERLHGVANNMREDMDKFRALRINPFKSNEQYQADLNKVLSDIKMYEDAVQRAYSQPAKVSAPSTPTTAGGSSIPLGQSLGETEKTTGAIRKQRDAAGDLIKSLKTMNATLGMSQNEATLYKLAAEGATKAQLEQAAVLLESIDTFQKTDAAQQQYEQTVESLNQEIAMLALQGRELVQVQAELQLGEYATDEQVQSVRALAGALYDAQVRAERIAGFGDNVGGSIRGDVPILTGGGFDDGTARYEAEAAAEQQRYAEQLERLREAEELKLEVAGGYDVLREQLYQEHSDRMAEIDRVRMDMQLSQWSDGFGQMATDIEAFAQVFGRENRAMFAISKSAAIAQTIIDTYKGAQAAFSAMASIPVVGPALGVAAASAAVMGGMARVANIRSQSMGGGRRYGGAVNDNKYYRVNEDGRPEIFKGSDGNQYMMPNQRGEVVSHDDATGGQQRAGNTVNVTQNITMRSDNGNYTARQVMLESSQRQAIAEARLG